VHACVRVRVCARSGIWERVGTRGEGGWDQTLKGLTATTGWRIQRCRWHRASNSAQNDRFVQLVQVDEVVDDVRRAILCLGAARVQQRAGTLYAPSDCGSQTQRSSATSSAMASVGSVGGSIGLGVVRGVGRDCTSG
jgi:hypothetical protein